MCDVSLYLPINSETYAPKKQPTSRCSTRLKLVFKDKRRFAEFLNG